MKEEIGKRITEIRKGLNMNKEQFAKLIGISGQYLGTVENGVNGLSVDKLMALCEKTNTSADYLLFGKPNIDDDEIKKVFEKIDRAQIAPAFEVLKSIAIIYSSYQIKAMVMRFAPITIIFTLHQLQ